MPHRRAGRRIQRTASFRSAMALGQGLRRGWAKALLISFGSAEPAARGRSAIRMRASSAETSLPAPVSSATSHAIHGTIRVGGGRRLQYGRFLDVVEKIPYLRDLGVTAIQPLPIQEYDGDFGLGYAGLDYFSPEMTYQVHDPAELARHVAIINAHLQARGAAAISVEDLVSG